MGLWELAECEDGLERKICQPMLEALRKAQRIERRIARTLDEADFKIGRTAQA